MARTSLTLRALFARAAAKAGLDALRGVTGGLTPAARALAAAATARAGGGVLLLVVPTDRDVEQVTADARFFYGALEGASTQDVEQAVLPFPSLQVDPYRGMVPHVRVSAMRARALHAAATGTLRLMVASVGALLPRVSSPGQLLAVSSELRPGVEIDPHVLAERLVDAGFVREDPVDEHGAFTIRGGIVDVFPAGDAWPARIEFVGDTIESLRRFDPSTQRSVATIDQLMVVPLRDRLDGPADTSPFDFLSGTHGIRVVVCERDQSLDVGEKQRGQLQTSFEDAADRAPAFGPPDEAFLSWEAVESRLRSAPALEELAVDADVAPDTDADATAAAADVRHVSCQPAREFHGRLAEWIAEVRQARQRGDTVLFVSESPGRAERLAEILREYDLFGVPVERAEDGHAASVLIAVGALSRGFRLAEAGLQVYVETDVFEEERRASGERRNLAKTFLSSLRDLKVGDLVVHVDHGIGAFVGLKQLGVPGSAGGVQEFLELKYHGDDKLFVPVERLDLVQKYSGGSRPALDRLGGTTWEKAKTRVRKAMRDMAQELLTLYAQRKAVAGHVFAPDTHWQQEFEDAFPFEPTVDQASAIADIKRDMESSTPMDRLLCGDVGYGKTEVAMRAAFKAVMDGKQVAVLAPTTVLAFQHAKTFAERFAGFPFTIEMVSRFRSKPEIQKTLEGLAAGRVDVIVGTHRLLSKDIRFKDLGLLVVDEEQRFGVTHKERIKQIRRKVDVLTLTATPIPRTLNMSLVGIRDMSVIETPPKDRLSIQTNVVKFDSAVIQRALRNELARGGQVYFVHNRVESIFSMANLLSRLVPEARIGVGHGQMGEEELERAMLGFVERRFDVLLATTIVENGLDIPNANTIIINRADRYGLSQLYQLRGRVGRSDRPAYAYLLIPPPDSLSPVARKRLAAIREFSDLGSGFRVAALDLEIRGAGNLLGGEQSGHIEAVGFEMYMKLLEETIRELKGEELEDDTRATVNLRVDLRIDETYVTDMNQRLMLYRQVAAARSEPELETIVAGLVDRYGPPPPTVLNLAEYGRLRILADALGIESIDREGRTALIRFRPQAKLDPARLVKVVHEWPGAVLVPPVSLKLDLEAPVKGGAAAPPSPSSQSPGRAPARPGAAGPGASRPRRRPEAPPPPPGSWWTGRATAGVVTPGFTRDEMLKTPERDPRADGGLFPRLEQLLRALG